MHFLCLDIGNTHAKFAIFNEQKEIVFSGKKEGLLVGDLNALKKQYSFKDVILSTTRNLRASFLKHLHTNYNFIHLDHTTPLPIGNLYSTPETLGRDRLAAGVGAWVEKSEDTHLVIDIGTCITYDLVYQSNFVGGNIAPGVYLRIKSMNDYTDKLPLVENTFQGNLLGRSTIEALQNGAVLGTICEIEAFIHRTKLEYGQINVTLTGGDGQFFAKQIDSEIFVDPYLVLKGLNEILQYNAK